MKALTIQQLETFNNPKHYTPGPFRQNGTEVESMADSHLRFVVCEHSALTNQDIEAWRKGGQGLGNPESRLPNFFEELERITALLNNLPHLIEQLKDAEKMVEKIVALNSCEVTEGDVIDEMCKYSNKWMGGKWDI